jgi:predicted dehydrogenase
MIKVGVIGCGKIAERASLPNLVNYKEKCTVTCLCDVEKSKAVDLAQKFNLKNTVILNNWKDLVKRSDVDVVFVDTPNYLHEEMESRQTGEGFIDGRTDPEI